MWHVIFYMPGDREIPLLAGCRHRDDVRLLGVVDPGGDSPGAALAEVMGLPVVADFAVLTTPDDTRVIVPRDRLDAEPLRAGRLHPMTAEAFQLLLAGRISTEEEPIAPAQSDPPAVQTPLDTPSAPLAAPAPETTPPPEPEAPPSRLRPDLAAALKTLGRIEEALDRERLPAWLLSVAVDAVGGDGGSLMLLDHRAEQLFIAAGQGLSDRILRTTRQPLDAGIAGRVARTGHAELVTETRTAESCNRGDISSALCVPLIHEDERLGVLNVNTRPPTTPFDVSVLSDLHVVGDAVARILHASAGAERLRHGRLHRRLDREFRELAEDGDAIETVLAGWSAALAMALSADHASLALVREDGSLLLAEGTAEGETRTGSVPQQHPAWNDVLQSGRPVHVRPEDAPPDQDGIAMYFLPVGCTPISAILAVRFNDPDEAHRFQFSADGVAEFLEGRLAELRRRHDEAARTRRLRDLAAYLARGQRPPADPDRRRADLAAYLKQAVGAVEMVFLPGVADLEAPRAAAARDLLSRVDESGWLTTTTSPGYADGTSSACMAVRRPGPDPAAGVVLFGKHRLDAIDSLAFTGFDAQLVRQLADLIPDGHERAAAPDRSPVADGDALRTSLAREIDRADRYHVAFSLSAFDAGPAVAAAGLLEPVSASLRASDLVFPGEDGRLFVIAPEETHAVGHMERRAVSALREAAGNPDLSVRAGRALYPGRDATPDELIRTALERLVARAADGD